MAAIFSRAEEAGFCGVLCMVGENELPQLLDPKSVFVSVEISSERPGIQLGGGAVIRVGDRASTFDGTYVDAAWAVARLEKLSARRALMDGGTCEATAFFRAGLRSGGLCAPVRHYHNMDMEQRVIAPEMVHASDLEALCSLIVSSARHGAVAPAEAPDPANLQFDSFLNKGRRLLRDSSFVGASSPAQTVTSTSSR